MGGLGWAREGAPFWPAWGRGLPAEEVEGILGASSRELCFYPATFRHIELGFQSPDFLLPGLPPDCRQVASVLSPWPQVERKLLFLEEFSSASRQPECFEPGGQQLVQVVSAALFLSPFLFPLSNPLTLPQKRKAF